MAARLGKFTASQIFLLMQTGKGKFFSEQAFTYIRGRIAELLTGQQDEAGRGYSLEWGKEQEPNASEALQARYPHVQLDYYGGDNPQFVTYDAYSGASPDAISPDALWEIKCPYVTGNYLPYLIAAKNGGQAEWLKKHSPQYYGQLQFGMMCCQRSMSYLCAYDPRMIDPAHRLSVLEVPADAEYQETLKDRLSVAVQAVKDALKQINAPSILIASPIPGGVIIEGAK